MDIHTKLFFLFWAKGAEKIKSGTFTEEGWYEYLRSVGCRFTLETDLDGIVVRDQTMHMHIGGGAPCIKVDEETATKILTLGLP